MPSRLTTLLLLSVCFVTSGCVKQLAEKLGNVVIVRNEIVKRFGEEVNVNVTNVGSQEVLSVTFVNSVLNEKSRSDRAKRASETVEIIKVHYPKARDLAGFAIGFVKQKTTLGVFHQVQTVDLFAFDSEAHPLGNTDGKTLTPKLDLETTANYLERSNETDVAVAGLQLDGVPDAGLTLVPHFTVAGNAKEKLAKPPSVVMFDFASYAQRQKFNGLVDFKFVVDGSAAVSTQGVFSPYNPPGATGQFCYLKFPYKAFRQMVNGDSLTIKIADEAYELTEEQLKTLKDMTNYVKE